MKTQSLTRIGAALAVSALALGVTACSGEQSVADACSVTQTAMVEVQSSVTAMSTGDTEALKEVQDALADAQTKVTNPEVSEKLGAMVDEFNGFAEDVSTIDLENPDVTDPETLEIIEGLSDRSAKLVEVGNEFDELCSAA